MQMLDAMGSFYTVVNYILPTLSLVRCDVYFKAFESEKILLKIEKQQV